MGHVSRNCPTQNSVVTQTFNNNSSTSNTNTGNNNKFPKNGPGNSHKNTRLKPQANTADVSAIEMAL